MNSVILSDSGSSSVAIGAAVPQASPALGISTPPSLIDLDKRIEFFAQGIDSHSPLVAQQKNLRIDHIGRKKTPLELVHYELEADDTKVGTLTLSLRTSGVQPLKIENIAIDMSSQVAGCGFASQIVAYLYEQIGQHRGLIFNTRTPHLITSALNLQDRTRISLRVREKPEDLILAEGGLSTQDVQIEVLRRMRMVKVFDAAQASKVGQWGEFICTIPAEKAVVNDCGQVHVALDLLGQGKARNFEVRYPNSVDVLIMPAGCQ